MCVSMCAHVSMDLKMESDFMALCSKYENHLLLLLTTIILKTLR